MSEKLKEKSEEWLEQYLAGEKPLHPGRLQLPSEEELDAAEAAFDAAVSRRKPSRRIPLWPWAAVVAAAAVVAFLLRSAQPTSEKETPLAQAEVPQPARPAPEQPAPSEPQESREDPKADESHRTNRTYKTYRTHKSYKTHKSYETHKAHKTDEPSKPCPAKAAPQPGGDVPVIPPEKQALVDIFLAEEALQVAYKLQEPQEELRAFYANFDEEAPDTTIHIIAI